MAPKQGTLNKFLKKPEPKQTTLNFGGKPSEKKKPPPPPAEDADVDGEGDQDMAEASSPVKETKKRKSPTRDEAQSSGEDDEPVTKRGRASKKQEDEEMVEAEEEEDEAPKKRGRPKATTKKSDDEEDDAPKKAGRGRPKKSDADKSPAAAKKKEEPSEEEDDDEPVKKRGRPKKIDEGVKEMSLDSKEKAKSKSPSPAEKSKKAAASDAEESAEESGSGSESAVSDDEKPAVKAKKKAIAKKVQQTLISKKPPYEDWPEGKPTPYAALAKTLTLIEGTSKRLEMTEHASLFMQQVLRLTPNDLLMVVYLMINKLAPDYSGIELGIGESILMKAISEATGRSLDKLKKSHMEIGDLGEIALQSRMAQPTLLKPKPLTVEAVYKGLYSIATTKGDGSMTNKISGIKKLISACVGEEAKFIVRGLEGKLRLGLAEKSVLAALAQAMVVWEKKKQDNTAKPDDLVAGERILKEVFMNMPCWDVIVPTMIEHGIFDLKDHCKMQPGVPLKPMLARPTKSIGEVLDRFDNCKFTCEYKYDGERVQLHYVAKDCPETFKATEANPKKGLRTIFSRNSEELSQKYPDILAALPNWINEGVTSFVLDCEAVAWDKDLKKVLPFQQLMTRKRKDVAIEDVKVKVCVFAFDLLFLNGKPVVQETFEERRRLLVKSFKPVDEEFAFAKYSNAENVEEIQTFLEESVKASCEGLMVKMLDGPESGYEPSMRSRNWLKIKKDYLSGVGDSLDLVVLGAYHGKGKRTSVFGAFLLACYNPSSETYETICNIGTGFSDELLASAHKQLSPHIIPKPKPYYSHSNVPKDQPDVWFEPKVVWEVLCADLTLSPRYKAAAENVDENGKGVSLRFPRFVRERDDKGPDSATSSRQVAEMYRNQESVGGKGKASKGVDDDWDY